ncbi:MAG: hypothetical protein ACRENX_08840 [Candidatus Dormibacteria bacterium]
MNIAADFPDELMRRRPLGKTLGDLASELLATAMAEPPVTPVRRLHRNAQDLGALIDLDDKEALLRALYQV